MEAKTERMVREERGHTQKREETKGGERQRETVEEMVGGETSAKV